MAQSSPPPQRKEALDKRAYTLRLTFSSLVTAGIVLVIGFGWAFFMGVMVGRGQNPESKVPQLATLLPSDERAAQDGREKLEDTLPKAEVMKPEELRFATTLRGKPGQNTTEPRPRAMQNATGATSMAPVVAPQPAAAAAQPGAASPSPSLVQQNQAAQAATPPAAQPKPAVEPMFDFVFQVATFKDTDSVDRLRARLEGKGLRSRMDRDGKLLKVMVLLRGTTDTAEQVRQQMVDMGLGQPIQRSKTPVRQKR